MIVPRRNRQGSRKKQPGGRHQVITATVPRDIVVEARKQAGKGGFSAFVSNAISRALIRQRQREWVEEYEREHGPLDEAEVQRFRDLLTW